jgi:predicted lipoprotein with Yx(FWY)xxD motif
MFTFPTLAGPGVRLGVVVAAPVFLLAACASGGSGGSSGYGSSGSSGSTASPGSAGSVAKVETHSGSMGTYLTNGSGRTLYLFAADRGGQSACSGACAAAWPPLTTKGKPVASGAAKASKLATITRKDGATQVTYGGHPLYTFTGDSAAGDTNGQGSSAFGAKWWLVSPSGAPLTNSQSGASGTSPSGGPSSSSGGAGGGWS